MYTPKEVTEVYNDSRDMNDNNRDIKKICKFENEVYIVIDVTDHVFYVDMLDCEVYECEEVEG